MTYKWQLTNLLKIMTERRNDLIHELENLPEGILYIYVQDGRYYYSERFPKGGNRKKEHRIGISNDNDKILALVRKRYVQQALEALDQNLSNLEIVIEGYVPSDEASIMKDYIEKYPQLTEGLFYKQFDGKKWEEEFVPDNNFYKEDLRSISLKGVEMRSDGEIYITSRLDHYNIPHRFEASLNSPLIGRVPDFTIIRPRDRKIIYWEHFGKVNDPKYVSANIEKVIEYIEYGITPWDNLIMTYNYSGGGFNAKLIDSMIEGWLL